MSNAAVRTLTLRIRETERQLMTATTKAERLCLTQTIDDCRRQLSEN